MYRGWKICYAAGGYTAKRNGITLTTVSRVAIERVVDKYIFEHSSE